MSDVGNDAALVGATGRTDNSKSTYCCYSCNNFGHIARDCPKSSGSHAGHTSSHSNSRRRPSPNRNTQHRVKVASQSEREFVFTAKDHDWIIDIGASSHMKWRQELLSDYEDLPKQQTVKLGDGRTVNAFGIGAVTLTVLVGNDKEVKNVLQHVLLVQDMLCNLLSVKEITEKGFKVMFDGPTCKIVSKNNNVAAEGTRNGNLYILQGLSLIDETVECANVAKVESNAQSLSTT